MDIQAEIALTDNFTAEIATGYTDARYTQDSRLVADRGSACRCRGAMPSPAKAAQPGAARSPSPWAWSTNSSLVNHASFVRVDDEYQSRAKWPSPRSGSDHVSSTTPANYMLSSTNLASARAGMNFGDWQIAAFVDNLTDTHTVTNYNWTIDSGRRPRIRCERQYTFRPRTIGLTFTYRH